MSAGKVLPVVVLPGLGNNAGDYDPLVSEISGRSARSDVRVADVKRYDWLRNAAGLTDVKYWQGNLNPRPTVDWYLEYIDRAVGDSEEVVLLAHSAGGWLGRVWMHNGKNAERVRRFVSLGSPHRPPPPGVIDQTRGILTYVENHMPGAHHENVEYVTIAGRYVKGIELSGDEEDAVARIARLAAGAGYKQVCGDATAWGDGITPVECAHLPGDRVERIDIEGAYHSPLGASEDRPWYGNAPHIDQWIDKVIVTSA